MNDNNQKVFNFFKEEAEENQKNQENHFPQIYFDGNNKMIRMIFSNDDYTAEPIPELKGDSVVYKKRGTYEINGFCLIGNIVNKIKEEIDNN